MEREIIGFELIYNSFRDEIFHKEMLVDKIEFEFNTKTFSQGLHSYKHTGDFVKLCRKMIEQFQRIFADIRSYFVELKLEFAYDIIYRMFRIFMQSYKTLSQMLFNYLKISKSQGSSLIPDVQANKISNQTEEQKKKNLQHQRNKQIQHLNFFIKNIEHQEERLSKLKQEAEKDFYSKRQSIENIAPSEAVGQLEQLKRNIDRIVENSQRLFDQNYIYRHQELRNRILAVKTPQQLYQILCNQFSGQIKNQISKAIQSSINVLLSMMKNKEKKALENTNAKKANLKNRQVQTVSFPMKHGKSTKTPKQIDQSNLEHDIIKKQNFNLSKELHLKASQLSDLKVDHSDLKNRLAAAEDMVRRKVQEIQQQKSDCERLINRKDEMIEILNQRIKQFKQQNFKAQMIDVSTECFEDNFVISEKVSVCDGNDDQLQFDIFNKSKTSSRKTQKMQGMFLERELKLQKSQNKAIRRSLTLIINTLNDQKLIMKYPLEELQNDIKSNTLLEKIKSMKNQIQNSIHNLIQTIIAKRMQDSLIAKKQTNQSTQTENNCYDNRSSRDNFDKQTIIIRKNQSKKKITRIGLNMNENPFEKQQEDGDHLQKLKKELMDKINKNRRSSNSKSNRQKTMIGDNSLPLPSNFQANKPLQKCQSGRKTQKSSFARKDVLFQELNFSIGDQNIPITKRVDKKKRTVPGDSTKDIGSFQKITNKYIDQEAPVITAQSINNWYDVNKIVQYIETKNDEKDLFFKKFMKSLMVEVRKRKGDKFLKQMVVSSGRNSGFVKQPKQIVFSPIQQVPSFHKAKGMMKNSMKKSIVSALR